MKKHTLYYIALSALAMLTGCSNEENFGLKPTDGNRSLTATIEQNDLSRTAVSEEGQVTWTETDAIGVFGTASQNIRFTYQSSTDNGNSATFRGDFPEEETMEQAYYPYQENATLSGNALTLHLPSEYTYTGNSNAPMLGVKNNDGTFTFKHLTGLLRITINNVPEEADRFVITSLGETDAPDLSGQATITDINAEDATLSITANGSKSITYNLGTLTEETGFRTFFIPLPVGEYPQLSVALYAKDSTDPYFTKTISDITVRRAVMIDMPILDAQTGAQYVLSENTTEITESMAEHISVSPDDNTTLIYGSGIAEEDVPQLGDIIFAKPSESLPYGFLGKVTSVSGDADKGYTIQTETASLYEAFDKLYINDTAELVAITSSSRTDDTEAEPVTGGFNISKDLKIAVEDEGKPYEVEGTLSTGASLQLTAVIDKEKHVKYMAFTFVPTIDAQVGFSISSDWNEDGDIGDFPLKDYDCGLILLGGVVPLVPAIQLHLYLQPQGNFSFGTNINCQISGAAGVEFNNNVWNAGFNPIKSNENQSPLDFLTSEIKVEGELFYGIGVELKGKLFNLDNMKMYVEPSAGLKIAGEFAISSDDTQTLEEKFKDISLTSNYILSGSTGLDATLLGENAELSADFPEVEWGEQEFQILPTLSQLSSKLIPQMSRAATSSSDDSELREVNIIGEASGELLTHNANLYFELEDAEGNVIQRSSPVEYNTQENGESLPLNVSFSGLQPDANYKAYVVVNSPMFSDVSQESRVELKNQAVEFDTNTELSDREILIKFYESTGGDNWTNNTNWCTDEPLSSWYGVVTRGGKVIQINLENNGLVNDANLTGLSDLERLDLNQNQLTSINVVGLDTLATLYCSDNLLKTLNITGAIELKDLQCKNNQLTTIDVSSLNKLEKFYCNNNNLKSVDVSNLKELIDLFCSNNPITSLNTAGCFNLERLSCGGKGTYLPDLDVSHLTNLTDLDIVSCGLTAIDVSALTKLANFDCSYNQLTDLDVTSLRNLEILGCYYNQLTNLDVSNLDKLSQLSCNNNKLTSLDISNITNLTILNCDNNQLTSLDISKLDQLYYLKCSNNLLTALDVSNAKNLQDIDCRNNQIAVLDVANLEKLTRLVCENNQIQTLTINKLKDLEILSCVNNQLTSLDASNLGKLTQLNCRNNQLISLDISNLVELTFLDCIGNQLTVLDISECNNLTSLDANNNDFQIVYISESQEDFKMDFPVWGEQDRTIYREPNHRYGWQYPKFIYK